MDARGPDGKFAPGWRGGPGRTGPNRRTLEIEELSKEIIERRGGVEGLLSRYFGDKCDPKLQLEAIKLVLGYGYGLPRQRIAVSGDGPIAVVIRRAGSGCDAPEPPSPPARDSEQPGEVPGDLGGAPMGEDPDGV